MNIYRRQFTKDNFRRRQVQFHNLWNRLKTYLSFFLICSWAIWWYSKRGRKLNWGQICTCMISTVYTNFPRMNVAGACSPVVRTTPFGNWWSWHWLVKLLTFIPALPWSIKRETPWAIAFCSHAKIAIFFKNFGCISTTTLLRGTGEIFLLLVTG